MCYGALDPRQAWRSLAIPGQAPSVLIVGEAVQAPSVFVVGEIVQAPSVFVVVETVKAPSVFVVGETVKPLVSSL